MERKKGEEENGKFWEFILNLTKFSNIEFLDEKN